MHESPLERQTERAAVMLTPAEKADVRLVAAFDLRTESDVIRSGIEAVSIRAAAIRAGEVTTNAA